MKIKEIINNIVPYSIRKLYFREYLRYYRIVYMKDWRRYKQEWERIKKLHIKHLAEINAFSALTQKPLLRNDPDLPEKPGEKTLIPFQVRVYK